MEKKEEKKLDENIYNKIINLASKQNFLNLLGIQLDYMEKGKVIMSAENKKEFSQAIDYMHGGMVATLLDTAGAYAALTLVGETEYIVTSELKINYIRPVISNKVFATGNVINRGKTIIVVEADLKDENDKLLAKMMGSMFVVSAKN